MGALIAIFIAIFIVYQLTHTHTLSRTFKLLEYKLLRRYTMNGFQSVLLDEGDHGRINIICFG